MFRTSVTEVVTIASGGQNSTTFKPAASQTNGYARGSFVTPSSLTSTSFTFQVSVDGSTWVNLYDVFGAQISITVAASRAFPLPLELFDFAYARIVAGSAEGADRSISLRLST